MKYIKKGRPPQPLKCWIRENSGVPGAQYGTLDFPTSATKKALLSEQGNLCAYAMVPIDASTSHIEHIKPQVLSRSEIAPNETWDYANLLACYPGNNPDETGRTQFGATKKDDAWEGEKFVSPLQESCENRFRFSSDGSVAVNSPGDEAAAWTIDTLGLDNVVLGEWRRAAIEAFGVSLTAPNPLKRTEAERLRVIVKDRREDGSFNGYCIAVLHAAEEYIALLDKRRKKKRYATKFRTSKRK